MIRTAVIIAAAGSGARTGLKTPKPFISLLGIPLVARTIEVFQRHRRIGLIQPVLPGTHLPLFRDRIMKKYRWSKCRSPVAGGRERQDSVFRGLQALPDDVELVVIHDAARPFVPPSVISSVLEKAAARGAALAALPVQDTVKRSAARRSVGETVDRRDLWLAQTPQAFRTDLLHRAHALAADEGFRGTDDASLVERLGSPVHLVPGSALNLKITTRDDLALARALLEAGKGGICK